jgi:ribosome-binding factor A
MARYRTGRVAEQIKKELGVLFQTELKDPGIGFVTVTGVEVTNDLSQAKVYLSVMGDAEAKRKTMEALERAAGYLRSEIGKRIRLRHTPELLFRFDESIDYGNRIEGLLAQIQSEEKSST